MANKQPTGNQNQAFTFLVVTRPQGQADDLVTALQSVVNPLTTVEQLPLLQIYPMSTKTLPDEKFHGVIFISGNAVNYFFRAIDPLDSRLANSLYLAVGENTAQCVLQQSGRAAIFPQQMNSEGLLALAELSQVAGQNWLIAKGEGGRSAIRETLESRGARVFELDLYERKLPDFSVQQAIIKRQQDNPLWLITSAEALTNLFRILGLQSQPDHQTAVIVSSDRLAALASQKGFTIIDQSAGASETQLVQCIKNQMTR